jgi:hypothetical protein
MNTETQVEKIRKLIDTQLESIAELQATGPEEDVMKAIINLRNLGDLQTNLPN